MKSNKFGNIGIVLGGVGLLLALVHFWAGPFAPKPALEDVVAEKVAAIKQKTLNALKGKNAEPKLEEPRFDADKIADIVTAVLGGLALIFAALSLTNHESKRAAGSAALLGTAAIVFQFVAMYAMAVLLVMLIVAVVGAIGGGA